MRNLDLRNPHIAVALGFGVLVVGCVLFKDAGEGALQLVALANLIVTFGTLLALDARDERRERREGREPQ